MTFVRLREWLVPAYYAVTIIVLLWNIVLAGQIAQLRRAPRVFVALTALAGLLVAPALFIAGASGSLLYGRALHTVAWAWPVTIAIFAAQSMYATLRRLVIPSIGIPIALFNLLLLAAAATRYASGRWTDLPAGILAFDVAQANALGLVLGREALFSALALQLPLLAPAYPARWRWSRTLRVALAAGAALWFVVIASELAPAVRAVRSFAQLGDEQLQERPNRDFAIGIRIFPTLTDDPPPLALLSDLALVDTLSADAVNVVIDPHAMHGAALDSLAASLDATRRDSTLLFVTLGYGRGDRRRYAESPSRFLQARVAMVEQVVRRLRPDYLLPALDPTTAGAMALGVVPMAWWMEYLRESAVRAHALRPRTRVAVALSAFTATDSVLYQWATDRRSALDVVGFSFFPSYGGGEAMSARLRVADRWMRGSSKEHWVFAAGAYPSVFGEASQARAVWGALAWATSHARVRGVIVESAGDYDAITGLRAPGGRLRIAVGSVQRARRVLESSR